MPDGVNNTWGALLGATGAGAALPWLLRETRRILTGESRAQSAVLNADARKTNAETDGLLDDRLWAEIERLDVYLKEVRDELKTVKSSAADEKAQLETENKRLRGEVRSLRQRVSQLEEIIKTKSTPADMQAMLDEIDRKTAKEAGK